jgi:ribosome recycling factor
MTAPAQRAWTSNHGLAANEGTGPFMVIDDKPAQGAIREEEKAAQKLVPNGNRTHMTLYAVGAGLFALVMMLRVRMWRGLRPATVLSGNGALVSDMSKEMAPGLGDNILEMKSHANRVSDDLAWDPLKLRHSDPTAWWQPAIFLVAPSTTARRPSALAAGEDGEDFDVDMMLLEAEEKMQKSIAACVSNLGSLRTGRASPDVLKRVVVDYYGAETPLNQLASISVGSASQLVVSPFDKSTLGDVERALLDANLGMTPNNDGEIIRLNIPQLTEDRRKEVAKEAKGVGEEAKVAVRSTRKKANDTLKKKGKDLSEDNVKDAQDQIQKLTDKLVKEIDSLVAKKEKEVMTV